MNEKEEIIKVKDILKQISEYDYKCKELVSELYSLGYLFSTKNIDLQAETTSFKATKSQEVIVVRTKDKAE